VNSSSSCAFDLWSCPLKLPTDLAVQCACLFGKYNIEITERRGYWEAREFTGGAIGHDRDFSALAVGQHRTLLTCQRSHCCRDYLETRLEVSNVEDVHSRFHSLTGSSCCLAVGVWGSGIWVSCFMRTPLLNTQSPRKHSRSTIIHSTCWMHMASPLRPLSPETLQIHHTCLQSPPVAVWETNGNLCVCLCTLHLAYMFD
jgi:hypothetical protein